MVHRPNIPGWAWSILDQAIIAITNLALFVALARSGGVQTLGAFALVTTTMLIGLAIQRMLLTEPWLATRTSGSNSGPTNEMLALVLFLASATAVAVAVTVTLVGKFDDAGWLYLVLGSFAWQVQDAGRAMLFKARHESVAAQSDGLIAIIAIGWPASTFALSGDVPTVRSILAAWTIGILLGAARVGLWKYRRSAFRGAIAWWKAHCRPLAIPLTQDGLSHLLGTQFSLYLLAALASPSTVGLVRIVISIYSPVRLTITGLMMWIVPHLSRGAEDLGTLRTQVRITKGLGAFSFLVILIALAGGPAIAKALFGPEATVERTAMVLGAGSVLLVAVGTPWLAAAKVRRRYRLVAWSRTVVTILTLGALCFTPMFKTVDGFLTMLLLQNLVVVSAAAFATRAWRLGAPTRTNRESVGEWRGSDKP